MKKQEIIAKIERAIKKCKREIAGLIELRIRAEAKREALEAVLFAIRGDGIHLNVEASKKKERAL